jgi:hypothetical protein
MAERWDDARVVYNHGRRRFDRLRVALVQRLVMEQPRPFDVGVAEAAFASL